LFGGENDRYLLNGLSFGSAQTLARRAFRSSQML
jgi:hypothetical protein